MILKQNKTVYIKIKVIIEKKTLLIVNRLHFIYDKQYSNH